MKRVLQWLGFSLAALVVVALIAVYGVSEYKLRRTFVVQPESVAVPTDTASVARGAHIAVTRGCMGCHGQNLAGKVFVDEPLLARLIAPNLPRVLSQYSDADLVRLLRHGLRPSGRNVVVMPSAMYYHLSDADLGALIAYLRSVPEAPDTLPRTSIRPLGRLGLTLGQFQTEADRINHSEPRLPDGNAADVDVRGRYLASTVCSECHGLDLTGDARTPSLIVVSAYTSGEFSRLMREGIARDGKEKGLMSEVARGRFRHFADDEVAALYAYLRTLSGATTGGGRSE